MPIIEDVPLIQIEKNEQEPDADMEFGENNQIQEELKVAE